MVGIGEVSGYGSNTHFAVQMLVAGDCTLAVDDDAVVHAVRVGVPAAEQRRARRRAELVHVYGEGRGRACACVCVSGVCTCGASLLHEE